MWPNQTGLCRQVVKIDGAESNLNHFQRPAQQHGASWAPEAGQCLGLEGTLWEIRGSELVFSLWFYFTPTIWPGVPRGFNHLPIKRKQQLAYPEDLG